MSKHTRSVEYAVVPVSALRGIATKTDSEVMAAQKSLDKGVISALEEMINAAKAGALESDRVLAMRAAMWE